MINAPGHQLYGVRHFKQVSKEDIQPIIYSFEQPNFGSWVTLKLNIKFVCKALTTKHDALYYGIDPQNLVLLCLLKRLGLYRKPMFAWKYTAIKKTGSFFKDAVLKLYYNAFNKIFMITEDHIPETYAAGIVKEGKLEYMKWGEDLDYIDQLKTEKIQEFTFISTGKAHRDYETLLNAFAKVKNARLKLYVSPNWGGQVVNLDKLNNIASENVVLFVVNKPLTYKDIYIDLLKSHCSLCICKPVNFGVGYTQLLDSMACGLPCILTWNKDNPIDIDEKGVGITVPPLDHEALAIAMQKIVDNKDNTGKMSEKCRKLVEEEYNIKHTAKNIVKIIIEEIRGQKTIE